MKRGKVKIQDLQSCISAHIKQPQKRCENRRIEALARRDANTLAIGTDLFKVMTLYCNFIETEAMEQIVDVSATSGDSIITLHPDHTDEHIPAQSGHVQQGNRAENQTGELKLPHTVAETAPARAGAASATA